MDRRTVVKWVDLQVSLGQSNLGLVDSTWRTRFVVFRRFLCSYTPV